MILGNFGRACAEAVKVYNSTSNKVVGADKVIAAQGYELDDFGHAEDV
jgi:hypothetical protein